MPEQHTCGGRTRAKLERMLCQPGVQLLCRSKRMA